jgi:hypothetical protein
MTKNDTEPRQGGNEKASPVIEVTPEMAHAGSRLIEHFRPDFDSAEDVARDVFIEMLRAMERASLRQDEPS